jgi:KEOPS complex subunit Pcc1
MKHVAIFRFAGSRTRRIYDAVRPEIENMGKSSAELWIEEDETLVLRVGAADIPSLRAALNTWLRLINIAKEMQEIVDDE